MKKLICLLVLVMMASGCVTPTVKNPIEIMLSRRRKVIDNYLKKHPDTPEEIKNKMLNHEVTPGMNKEQVIAVVDKPSSIQHDSEDKTKEEWIYSGTNQFGVKVLKDIYYYFENGILVSWENELQRYVRKHPELFPKIKEAILKNKVIIGMNKEQVKLIFGTPRDINRTVNQYGVSEQWVYGNALYGAKYLYFENGVFVSWQD